MIVGWTGHRPELFRDATAARQLLEERAALLLGESAELEFVVGGQRGVDHWAAQFAVREAIPFALILPIAVPSFARSWLTDDLAVLEWLMSRAQSVEIVDQHAHLGALAFDRRNELIAQRCNLLQVVWTGLRQGGTFYTVCAAQQRRVPIDLVELERSSASISGRGT
jgi:hypothetical protein